MLRFNKVRKYYSRLLTLDIQSLELDSNVYWVKGENGSGKSTLLRMAAGLLPFEGNIGFNDVDMKSQPVAYRRQVSWSDAEPMYPAFVTGRELLEFYREIRGSSLDDSKRLTSALGMEEYLDLKTGTYSSGTLKKLSLLLAFIGNAPLLLLDEPLITLDNASVEVVCALVQEKRNGGGLILLSSHLENDALVSFCDKQLLVNHRTVTT